MQTLIDYTFDDPTVKNPDGSYLTTFTGAQIGTGPGDTSMGSFQKALDLGTAGKAVVDITGLKPDFVQFCVRIVFKATGPVTDRQTLVESNLLPFTLFIDKGTTPSTLTLHAQVNPDASVWAGPTTAFKKDLVPETWYVASLVYDANTVGLFVDDDLVSVYAFPKGAIKSLGGAKLFIGAAPRGKNHFAGSLAALQWDAGIPDEWVSLIDERRSDPEWFVTYKYESLRGTLDLGEARGALALDTSVDAYTQQYDQGAIMFHDAVGAAFEMHGAIRQLYGSLPKKADLGYLVSDEVEAANGGGRKSLFSKGGIYWSGGTGAIPVIGQIYLDYEAMNETKSFGFPVKFARAVSGGAEQEFQGCRMYCKDGAAASHEVHGDILNRFLAVGGVGAFGFPITNESDVMKDGKSIGRFSEFEGCTFYWSPSTGAHEVHGDIRAKYRDELSGPAGVLGFPTSDEGDIPGVSGPARFNTFQQGSILWFGSWGSMIVAMPFTLYVGRIDSQESEGAFMGQNDLYMQVTVTDGGSTVYNQRHPSDGDFGGHNIIDLDLNIPAVITPNQAGKTVTLTVDVWESDDGAPFGEGDDHLGVWKKTLNIANGWGLRDNNGIFNSGSFDLINSITASVKPKVDPSSLSETQKFWGVKNRGTPTVSWDQYASAFSDVDSESEWWDITDWLEKAFYELVIDTITDSGNCFGMSLEAINARKGASLFGLPIDRFTNWDVVRNEFNIKHCYQVGSGPIWWFVGEFLSGNTHDPKDVFTSTSQEASRGNQPVLCLAQNYDFSGKPHCILPVAWDSSSKPWKITICDPNFPGQLKQLTVDPDKNTFHYDGASTYDGGEWSGGRLHYMPYDLVCSPPNTPIWDAVALILTGTVILLGDDAQTASITDGNGNDLDGHGDRAKKVLQSNGRLDGFFVGFKGYSRKTTPVSRATIRPDVLANLIVQPKPKGSIPGEIHLRRSLASPETVTKPGHFGSILTHSHIGDLVQNRRIRPLATALSRQADVMPSIAHRTIAHVANDEGTMSRLHPEAQEIIGALASISGRSDFVHTVEAVRAGQLDYTVKQGLTEINLQSTLATSERTAVQMRNPGSSKQALTLTGGKDKSLSVRIENKLGLGKDRLGITVSNIPTKAGAPVEINSRPGIGGLDIVAGGETIEANVAIDAVVDGRKVKRNYSVPIEGGVRVNPASVLAENTLDISRIDRLFGPALSRGRIRRNT